MKIVMNALAARGGGGETYIVNFLKHFPEYEPQLLVICGSYNEQVFRNAAENKENISFWILPYEAKAVLKRTWWEIFLLPSFLKKNHCDVYYAPSGIMSLFFGTKGIRKVTALRNMLPFDERERKRFPVISFLRWKLLILRYAYLLSYRLADGVVFISHYSRDCVKKYLPKIEQKSQVIYHGLNDRFLLPDQDTSILATHGLQPDGYLLYVSILDYYKAQKEVIAEWLSLPENEFRYPLVLVGACINDYGREVAELAKNSGGKVRYLGKVEYEKLPALYQNAKALLFASSCECCPNILLEKMAAGLPIFSSYIEPMPEFAGSDAYYFDPYKPGDFIKCLRKSEQNQEERIQRGKRLHERAAILFNWSKTIKTTLNFLMENKKKQENV